MALFVSAVVGFITRRDSVSVTWLGSGRSAVEDLPLSGALARLRATRPGHLRLSDHASDKSHIRSWAVIRVIGYARAVHDRKPQVGLLLWSLM